MAIKLRGIVMRAVIAIALLIGFYLLAFVMAGVLLYLAYLTLHARVIFYKVTLLCLGLACTIIWSIVPRREKFCPPGPRLDLLQHPGLCALLQDVAAKTREKFPREVYISASMNAGVSEQGGVLGIFGRRIMILGLPLLQVLSVGELRAVLVHEFGHYCGGDTKLTPLIYRTRSSIARTLQNLGDGITHMVFRGYGQLFLRITRSIARHQEFAADELAARLAGARTFSAALCKLYSMSPVYELYWRHELAAVLNAGYLPPYINGFQHFLQCTDRPTDADGIQEAAVTREDNPYDTHPTLGERLKAIEGFAEGSLDGNTPAISLIENLPFIETSLFASIACDAGQRLTPLAWEEVGEKVYVPLYTAIVSKYAAALAGLTIEDIRDIARDPQKFMEEIRRTAKSAVSAEDILRHSCFVLGAALTVTLAQKGWQICALPGEKLTVKSKGAEFAPLDAVNRLFAKALTMVEWRELCQELGICEVVLWSSPQEVG